MKEYILAIKILSAAAFLAAVFFASFVFYYAIKHQSALSINYYTAAESKKTEIFKKEEAAAGVNNYLPPAATSRRAAKLLFFGDLMLDRHVGEKIKAAKSQTEGLDYIFGKLASSTENGFFTGYDLAVCNLEGAATDKGAHYAPANLYDFAFAPELINGLKKYNFNFFNLANNHFSDQGERGIMETKKNLDALGFNYAGCKDKQTGDCSYKIIEIAGKKIGMAGFSMVYGNFDLNNAEKIVGDLASSTDLVIANIHWGVEYQHEFNKMQQKIGRALLDAGADMIIGHHPHVAQGMEIYQGKPIFYSLGNFVFDQYFSPDTQEGLAVGIDVDFSKDNNSLQSGSTVPRLREHRAGAGKIAVGLFPIKSKASRDELMAGEDKEKFLQKFAGWSEADEAYSEQICGGKLIINK